MKPAGDMKGIYVDDFHVTALALNKLNALHMKCSVPKMLTSRSKGACAMDNEHALQRITMKTLIQSMQSLNLTASKDCERRG